MLMSEGRESFNLRSKRGIKNFFRRGLFGDKWARKFVLYDTVHNIRQNRQEAV